MRLEAALEFDGERQEWVALIINEDGEVICLGCEQTREAVREWAAQALLHYAGIEGAEHPLDMYERGSVARH